MSVAELLEGRRVCICAGPGGVGKTTTSAAIAVGMAASGLRVALVTIDPARRLATALGLESLSNQPRLVPADRFAEHGVEMKGELWAMMLDAKRNFDELIERLAPDAETTKGIFENRIYQELSSAVAGSQEFTAIAKLHEIASEERFDLIVLDTPPSRNALDFLDAPDRLTNFFEGRALKVFLRPTGIGAKVIGRGTGLVFSVLRRVTGVDLLEDVSTFFQALGGLIDGFRERAAQVKAVLRDPGTTFLLVSAPEREPARETAFFAEQLAAAGMPLGGLVVNRVRPGRAEKVDVDALTEELTEPLGARLAEKVAESYREDRTRAAHQRETIAELQKTLGKKTPALLVPELEGDVHDIESLARIQRHLFTSEGQRKRLLSARG
ncbi:MAG: ArsA family ATPase [Solirubrobacteraceae bacterium]